MGRLLHIQTLWAAHLSALSQVSRFSISRNSDGIEMTLYDVASREENRFVLGEESIRPEEIETQSRGEAETHNLTVENDTFTLDRYILEHLSTFGGTQAAYLNGSSFYGFLINLHALEVDGANLLLTSRESGTGIGVHTLDSSGQPSTIEWLPDSTTTALNRVSDITSIQIEGLSIVLTSSIAEDCVNTFQVTATGELSFIDTFGVTDGLPIDQPSLIESVVVAGRAFVLVGSYGTSSISVLSLDTLGNLDFVSQVLDDRETRFENISALATFSSGELHLVAASGSDGGVSLYQLLPDGWLLHRQTVQDSTQMALASIEQLEFVENGNYVELWAMSSRDQGLTRLAINASNFGSVISGGNGTDLDDTILATEAGGQVNGRDGDDVIVDGLGSDELTGGTGSDVFVFSPDTNEDFVRDFEIFTDRVDLTAYERLYSAQDIEHLSLHNGIRLELGEDTLTIYGIDGQSITIEQLASSLVFGGNYVDIPEALPLLGSSENDMFIAGSQPETIDGKAGVDTVSYVHSSTGVVVSLNDSSENRGGAEGDILVSIEGLIGTSFNDMLMGNAAGNNLTGLAGDDELYGNAGNDWLTPGSGNDLVDGGAGSDMVSFVDASAAVIADLTVGTVRSGQDTNHLLNIENVTGSVFGDFIRGDENANRIRGLGDYDWIVGSDGLDQIDGGTGRDMISYVYAPSRVEVDLGASIGLLGQAAGDRYVSIERVTGSIYSDLFLGSDGEDDFRGLGGYDWFVGSSGGKDRYYGGSGFDMVSYAMSDTGVTASLLLQRGSTGDAARDLYDSKERLTGSNYDDELSGDNNRNELRGMFGEDTLLGHGGVDRLRGGGSDDYLDGGAGFDYAIFDSHISDYEVIKHASGTVTVEYLPGYGEGTDTLVSIEAIQFADDILFL